jgi:hypothetical protein
MGCELPLELPKKWPFGLDRIKDLWETNAEGRLLAYLCEIAEDYEPQNNLSQYLLFGPRAFHVLHPKNLEAVLSKNFKGDSHSTVCVWKAILGSFTYLVLYKIMGSESGLKFSHPCLGMASSPRRGLNGSIQETFCTNSLKMFSLRTLASSARMLTI